MELRLRAYALQQTKHMQLAGSADFLCPAADVTKNAYKCPGQARPEDATCQIVGRQVIPPRLRSPDHSDLEQLPPMWFLSMRLATSYIYIYIYIDVYTTHTSTRGGRELCQCPPPSCSSYDLAEVLHTELARKRPEKSGHTKWMAGKELAL